MKRDGAALPHLPHRSVRAPEDEDLRAPDTRYSIGDRIHQLNSGRNDFGRTGRVAPVCARRQSQTGFGRVFTVGFENGMKAR